MKLPATAKLEQPAASSNDDNSFIPYCQHYLDESEIREVTDTLRSAWLTAGPKTAQFEKQFAAYVGSRYAIAVGSCTAGLHLALVANDIGPGDEVITTPFTFCATAEVVEYQQAKPVFVDIDSASFNIDTKLIEDKITSKTKAIMPVHYGGIPCNLDEINRIADKHSLVVIEDAAHAVGAIYRSRRIGSTGNPTVFSFYPTKNMTTGEGGMVTTNDKKLAESLKELSLHGMSKDAWKRYGERGKWSYTINRLGFKYNFTDLQASLGIQQLKKLDKFNATREKIAREYIEAFKGIPEISVPEWYHRYFDGLKAGGFTSPWHLFVIMIEHEKLKIRRDEFIEELGNRGIGTSVHFIPLHFQPYYAEKYGYKRGDFPISEKTFNKLISLPLYPKLTSSQVQRVITAVQDIVAQYRL